MIENNEQNNKHISSEYPKLKEILFHSTLNHNVECSCVELVNVNDPNVYERWAIDTITGVFDYSKGTSRYIDKIKITQINENLLIYLISLEYKDKQIAMYKFPVQAYVLKIIYKDKQLNETIK